MTVTVEQIEAAVEVLDTLVRDQAWGEMADYSPLSNETIRWSHTAEQLLRVVEARKPKPFTPKVYVHYDEADTSVYVQKTDGKFVAVYVGSAYDGDELGGSDRVDGLNRARGTLVFGG